MIYMQFCHSLVTWSAFVPTIYLPIPRYELFKKIVFYCDAGLWNELSPNVHLCDDISSFKNESTKYIVDPILIS